MAETPPVVYVFNGEDEFAIAEAVNDLQKRLDDNPATADMNTTRLDGNTYNPDQLLTVAGAMPFLARRRLVILTHPLAKLKTEPQREKFRSMLENLPPTTALVLIEDRVLTGSKERKDPKKHHWLERWATDHPERAIFKTYFAPKGGELVKRIQMSSQAAGGRIDPDAAARLADLVDADLRVAQQEIGKLLAYANYARPITYDDVELLTADTGQGDVFVLVDSLAARDGRSAMQMLRRLMDYNDYFSLYGMIARQFRLLVQAREILDGGGQQGDIQRQLKLHPFVAEKLTGQARRLGASDLEAAYHRLLEVDTAVKTGLASGTLALEFFVTAFTTAPDQRLVPER